MPDRGNAGPGTASAVGAAPSSSARKHTHAGWSSRLADREPACIGTERHRPRPRFHGPASSGSAKPPRRPLPHQDVERGGLRHVPAPAGRVPSAPAHRCRWTTRPSGARAIGRGRPSWRNASHVIFPLVVDRPFSRTTASMSNGKVTMTYGILACGAYIPGSAVSPSDRRGPCLVKPGPEGAGQGRARHVQLGRGHRDHGGRSVARRVRRPGSRGRSPRCICASTTFPFLDRLNAGVVARGARPARRRVDARHRGDAARGDLGIAPRRSAGAGETLIVAAENAAPRPASPMEMLPAMARRRS